MKPTGITLGLAQHVLRPEGKFFGFYDPKYLAGGAQRIVGWAGLGGILLDGAMVEVREGGSRRMRYDAPTRLAEPPVNKLLAREPFGVVRGGGGHQVASYTFPIGVGAAILLVTYWKCWCFDCIWADNFRQTKNPCVAELGVPSASASNASRLHPTFSDNVVTLDSARSEPAVGAPGRLLSRNLKVNVFGDPSIL